MNVKKWEVTIQTMTEEFNRAAKESAQILILTEWRKSLAKEPHLLQPFQIDEIVRQVRKRSKSGAKLLAGNNSETKSIPQLL